MGAEDVVVDADGFAWTGTEDGSIFRVSPDGSVRTVGNTGGRPLGIELYGEDRLLDRRRRRRACSTMSTHHRRRRAAGHRGRRAPDGVLQQRRRRRERRHLVLRLQHRLPDRAVEGRLRRAHPRPAGCCAVAPTARVEVHLDGLAFANGVALAADESFVCVAESGAADRRTPVADGGAGRHDATCSSSDLPGYPDNIARGSDGLIWVTIASPVDPLVRAAARPRRRWLRAQGGHPDPASAAAEAEADRPGAGLRRQRAAGARHRRRRGRATTWSPASGSTTGEVWLGSLEEPRWRCSASRPSASRLSCSDRAPAPDDARSSAPMGHLEHISGPQDLRGLDDRAARPSWPRRSATS